MLRAPKGARLTAEHELPDGQVRVLTSIDIPIPAPCDQLALGGRPLPRVSVVQRAPVVGPVDQQPLLLASSPTAVPTLRLPSDLTFTRLAGGVDFVKIAHRGWDGVTVSGWVPRPRVEEVGSPVSIGAGGECACGSRGVAVGRRSATDPYEGPAKLREGASIHDARSGGVWARGVANGYVFVRWSGDGDPWVRIEVIPGIDDLQERSCQCAGISHAFVARENVQF